MSLRTSVIALLTALICCLAGCATMNEQQNTSSLVAFLYPKGQPRPLTAETATLKLPVKVGIAFVPGGDAMRHGMSPIGPAPAPGMLGLPDQVRLMDEVAAHFRKYPYIKTVEVIPSNYLTPGGGFANLDALAAMYDVDVVALVSYDQVQHTDEGAASLLYWTIVGAYLVPGEKDSTTTFVDTAVFDVASRKLLFRAPGIATDSAHGTAVNNSQVLRESSIAGFDTAFQQMNGNLDQALADFKQKVKDEPDQYKVSYAEGYHGGGAYGWFLLVLLVSLWLRKRLMA